MADFLVWFSSLSQAARQPSARLRATRLLATRVLATLGVALALAVGHSASAQSDMPVGPNENMAPASSTVARDTVVSGETAAAKDADPELRFTFSGADWSTVMNWFAEQAELSLQLDVVPSGTFTFNDPKRGYKLNDALDILNLSLLKRGYVAVRRGRLLQIIDLEVENSDKLISEIAELVSADKLEQRGRSDIVSSVFPLGSMTPDAAREELAQLVGPWGRVVVLESARQVKVTESAEKLISIRDVLKATVAADTEVTELQLKNRGAGEILEIARPLLGLEPGQNANDQLRISVGLLDDRIYVTGQPVKVGLLKSLVERADKPLTSPDADAETEAVTPVFKTHPVSTADSTTVFDVLQTLLAGTPDARITIEPNTKAIIAFARPETHKMIADTIAELEGRGRELQIFKLRRLDPAQALLTINKFFGVTDDGGSGPTVDGNPDDGKLWVRGTREQIDMVANLLDQLEGDESFGALGDKVRLLNVNNAEMQDALQRAIMLWPITGRSNAIRQLPSTTDAESATDNPPAGGDIKGDSPAATDAENPFRQSQPELTDAAMRQAAIDPAIRLVNENQQAAPETKTAVVDSKKAVSETPATGNPAMTPEIRVPTGSGADIIIQMTPAGLMIASEDTDALDEFEALLESLSGQAAPSDEPKIFWLKHAEAEPTAEFISQILGGAEGSLGSVVDSATSSLGGGMLGGLMSLAGGGGGGGDESSAKSVLTASGSVSIVPDARLNALVVQANPADLSLIQLLIDKFDVADSPEDIQFRARPRVLQVIYQDAGEIATVVKEVMGDRIAGQEQKNARGGGGQPDPREIFAALRGGNRAKSEKTKSEAPKISIAVDKKSNTLVVVASPQDYEEVEELVRELDEAGASLGETTVTIAAPGGVNGEAFVKALEALSGNSVNSESGKSAGNTTESSSSSQNASSAAEIQRRIEFFRSRFGGGTPGGAPGGRGGAASGRGSSGRGGPGGGARGGGGGPRGGRGGR